MFRNLSRNNFKGKVPTELGRIINLDTLWVSCHDVFCLLLFSSFRCLCLFYDSGISQLIIFLDLFLLQLVIWSTFSLCNPSTQAWFNVGSFCLIYISASVNIVSTCPEIWAGIIWMGCCLQNSETLEAYKQCELIYFDKSTAVWNGVTSVFLIFLLFCFLVTCHSTNCLVAFLQNWVNCKISFLCKFMVFFPCGWSSTFVVCLFIKQI